MTKEPSDLNEAEPSQDPTHESHAEAIEKYRHRAVHYDRSMRRTAGWRWEAVKALQLEPGQTVVDVACGTGGNFAALLERIGPDGRLIGVDLSAEMLSVAEARVKDYTWRQVTLIEAPIEEVELAAKPDAAFFSFTHDVLQSAPALDNLSSQLASGARVTAVGAKRPSRWNFPLNAAMRLLAGRYVTSFDDWDEPWRQLERRATLEVETFALGTIYLAHGRLRPTADAGG